MKVVNFFGEPNAGKSTMAAAVFASLRFRGIRAELVTEYAKDLVWAGTLSRVPQDEILAEQYLRLQRLEESGVTLAITDSPLLLQSVYGPENAEDALDLWNTFANRSYLVVRPPWRSYAGVGRAQTEEQALALRPRILEVMAAAKVRYAQVVSCRETAEMIADEVAIWSTK